jgi:hypothetical protein
MALVDPERSDSLARAVKRLTIAVWALIVVIAIQVAFYLSAYIPSVMMMFRDNTDSSRDARKSLPTGENFHELPTEELIKAATVITLSKHVVEEGKGKCVLTEILKQAPGVRFYYKIGDSFRHCSFDPAEEAQYGNGQITFFAGNPAEMRYAITYFDDRVSSLGDMPLEELRRLIAEDLAGKKEEAPLVH